MTRAHDVLTKIKRECLVALWKFLPTYTSLSVQNTTFHIPLRRDLDHKIMGIKREAWMQDIIAAVYARDQGVFLDIGANVGQTMLQLKAMFPEVEYLGFEPNAYCCGYINDIIQLNRLAGCRIFPVGLGDNDTIATLFCQNISDPKGTVVANFRGREASLLQQPVLLRHGGRLLASLGVTAIALMKIDVEGYESSVLGGLRDILRQQRPFVMCEVLRAHQPGHPSYDFRVASRKHCEALLRDVDYAIWAADAHSIVTVCEQMRDDYTNYLFAPQERQDVVQAIKCASGVVATTDCSGLPPRPPLNSTAARRTTSPS
jgi:FkbM family methyltransferase